MASLADEKRKEMEAEMSRFEQEILGPSVPVVPVISSGIPIPATSIPQVVVPASLTTTVTQPVVLQTRPAFIPHQIQIRHPTNPPPPPPVMMSQMPMPPMPPMGPPMMPGPPMGHMMPPSMGPPGPPGGPMPGAPMAMPMATFHPPQLRQPAVLSKPPTMYSAPPIKFNQKSEIQTSASGIGSQRLQPEYTTHMTGSMTNMAATTQDNTQTTMSSMQGVYASAQSQGAEQAKEDKSKEGKAEKRKKKYIRTAAGLTWEDDSLNDWDNNDFRIFCGDLGNEVTDELLTRVFSKFPSFTRAKVVRDKRTNKTKGFGFVSFKDPNDFIAAMREMNGRYVGNRPIKLRKSTWSDRNIDVVRKKHKEKERLGLR
ncbi:RNA-binding protein 42-like isoform X1 [Glandiceps talaboti]